MGLNPIVEIRRDPGQVTVVLKPLKRRSPVMVLGAISATVAAVVVVVARLAGGARTALDIGGLLVELALGLVSVTFLVLAWNLVGREVVTATPQGLTIERQLVWRRLTRRTYRVSDVTELRAMPAGQVRDHGRMVTAAARLEFGPYDSPVRFGAGLEGSKAEWVVASLKEGLGT